MKIVRPGIQITSLILIFCTFVFAGQQEQSWEYKDWTVETHDDFVRCITHGQVVHGHEFSIVKKRGNRNQNILYIIWSASDKRFAEHEGKDAVLRFEIDGIIRRQATIVLLSVKELYPGRTIGVFTNFAVGEEFISLLKKGQKLEVSIHGPDELVNTLDITSDTFSLNGFTATMLKAQEFYEPTINQSNTSGNPTLTSEPFSRQNTINNLLYRHKKKSSNERSNKEIVSLFFASLFFFVSLFFILRFIIFPFLKFAAKSLKEAYKVVNKKPNGKQAAIDFSYTSKEKTIIEVLVNTLSAQQSFFCDHAGLIPQRAKDNWSMGYVYGYSDAFLKHNGSIGTFTNLNSLQILITTLDSIFDGQGQVYLQRYAELQKAKDTKYNEGLSKGSKEMIDWLQNNKNIPLGWAMYVNEIQPEDIEKPKVIPVQANIESTKDGIRDANSHEKSFSYPEETKSSKGFTMKSFFENIGSVLLIALFVGAYFPVNMILAFIFGDKMDVVISLFLPFYGYFVMLF